MRFQYLLIPALAAMSLAGCEGMVPHHEGPPPPPYHHTQRDTRMHDGDQVYRDRDGRYYCKRSDGTTGTIVGAIAGGVLGNIIAPGGSKTLGTILGAMGGAVAGNVIDRDNIHCE